MTDEFLLDFEKFVSEQEYSISKLVFFLFVVYTTVQKEKGGMLFYTCVCLSLRDVFTLFVCFDVSLLANNFNRCSYVFFHLCFWWEHIYITKRWNFTLFYYVVSKIILFIWRVLLNSRAIEPTLLTMNSNCVNHSAF